MFGFVGDIRIPDFEIKFKCGNDLIFIYFGGFQGDGFAIKSGSQEQSAKINEFLKFRPKLRGDLFTLEMV